MWLIAAALAACGGTAWADPMRRLFEPTDLALEDPGVSEWNMQAGLVRGPDAYRLVIPDFELDLGLTRSVELDVDGALALEDAPSRTFAFDTVSPDNLWLSLKTAIVDVSDVANGWGVGFGIQLGPKLPVAQQAAGVGGEGLALVGMTGPRSQLTLNMGGFIDPAVGAASRPGAVEGGLDYAYALDASKQWSLTADLSGVRFFTPDADQLNLATGIAYDPTATLEISVMALCGFLRGSDRYGVLLGISPKFHLW